MKRRSGFGGNRLSRSLKGWLYGVSLIVLLSGALWLLFEWKVRVAGEFGEERHPLQAWWLKLHGAAAMGFLVMFGTLLRGHIAGGWRRGRRRTSGGSMTALSGVLILTGYGLYYAGSETLRPWISAVHWIVGLLAAGLLAFHRRGAPPPS
jgi:hypothetical protein